MHITIFLLIYKEWSRRHGYRDNTVTDARSTRYFSEITGDIDPMNPNFQPLRKQKIKDDGLGGMYKPETIDFYVKAVVDLWTEQNNVAPIANASRSPRKLARPHLDAYKRKIGKSRSQDIRTLQHHLRLLTQRVYSYLYSIMSPLSL